MIGLGNRKGDSQMRKRALLLWGLVFALALSMGLVNKALAQESVVAKEEQPVKYVGEPISVDFQNADIRTVLRLLSEISGLNIVISESVTGKVTMRLINVPWDQVLALVLKTQKLAMEREGNVVRILPQSELAAERREQLQSKEAKLRLEELQMVLIPVNYADASSVASQIRTLLSPRGVVSIDSRTNTLIVKDIPRYINQARNLIQALDTPTPQVIIEARIVEANTEFTRELGIAWGGRYVMDAAHGNPTGLVFPNSLGVQGIAGQSTSYPNLNYVVNMPAPVGLGSGGGIDIVLGSIDDTLALDLQLSAMETTGEGRVVSRPRVTTMDNQSATITQGVSIPYQTRTAGEAAMNFIEANLTLNVKPHVTADNNIVMELSVQRNAPNLSIPTATGNPAIDKKEANTNAMVRDGETIVIGGILVTEQTKSELAVPWLSRIPILGFFFRERKWVNSRKELLIFITPRILRERPQV